MSTVRPHANAAPAPVLEVTGLDVHYGRRRARRRALHDVTLAVAPGETLGVIGETGSGKSTLARTVLGLVRASAGSVVVGGEDVTGHGPRQWRALRRRGVVQYVFQDPLRSLDPDLTVEDSLTEPLLVQGVTRAEAARRAAPCWRGCGCRRTCSAGCPGSCPAGSASGSPSPAPSSRSRGC